MSTTPKWWPNLKDKTHPDVDLAIKFLYNGLQEHEQAFSAITTKVDAVATTAAAAAKTAAPATGSTGTGANAPVTVTAFPTAFSKQIQSTLGTVDNDTSTAKTVQGNNYGGLVTLDNASPVTLTLNPAVPTNFFTAVQNLGAGTATLVPGSGNINNVATLDLDPSTGLWLFWDGVDWWATTATPTGGGGVPSVNGITGAVTIAAGTGISIATVGSTITVTATGSAGYLKGTVTVNLSSTSGTFYGTATIVGAAVNMGAVILPPFEGVGPGPGPVAFPQGNLTASVNATDTVECAVTIAGFASPPGNITFPVVVFA